jgi:alpha/beta superfamily hydrolase
LQIAFPGPTGTLEGYIHLPQNINSCPGVAVCHPHPQMGGDMNNSVVMGICYALERSGIASLRFNFRGVGKSQGTYDDGKGEIADALAALKFLTSHKEIEQGNVGLAGYSFGAGIAMKAALHDDLPIALSIVGHAQIDPNDDLNRKPSLPMQFVIGEQDKLIPLDQLNNLSTKLTVSPEIHIIPGADHFFHGQEIETVELVAGFFLRWLKPLTQI